MSGLAHFAHFVMSILTGFLWVPIWIVCALCCGASKRNKMQRTLSSKMSCLGISSSRICIVDIGINIKKFYKDCKFLIWLIVLGIPALYCEVQWFARTAAVAGCHSSGAYDGSYDARVYCNRKADALTWGRKRDFEGLGRAWTWDNDAEIYVIKGEMK